MGKFVTTFCAKDSDQFFLASGGSGDGKNLKLQLHNISLEHSTQS